MSGKLSVTYTLRMRDIHVAEPGPFRTRIPCSLPATATLKRSRAGFTLIIEIVTDDPSGSSKLADSYAAQLADHLTLWFCDQVKGPWFRSEPMRSFRGRTRLKIIPLQVKLYSLDTG